MSNDEYGDALPMTPVEDASPRGRRSANIYTATLRKFWEGEPKNQRIDLHAVNIKGQTLRVGLLKAIDEQGLEGKVEVSIYESSGEAVLRKVAD